MNKQKLIDLASSFVEFSEDNYIDKSIAITEDLIGLKLFDTPILGFGSSDDEYFNLLKNPKAIGSHFILPKEWLLSSNTVVSIFLPFTEKVRRRNSLEKVWPSSEWLHGRIEGQVFVNKLCDYLNTEIIKAGYECIVPSLNRRQSIFNESENINSKFTSNWSERHVAHVCGLGTFGLSKGLITKKGIAGRIGSLVSSIQLDPDPREYNDIYEYCSNCGDCIKQCPVNAITFENGKNHEICNSFLDLTMAKFKPRYGCGKCQVNVACESCIPEKISK